MDPLEARPRRQTEARDRRPAKGRDETWYLRNKGRLMMQCMAMVRDERVAEDIVQETFARAIAEGLRRDRRSGPWLRVVARNLCIDHLRRGSRMAGFVEFEDADAAAALERVDDRLDASPRREALRAAFEGMRERDRRVLWLHDVEGWEHAQIAHLDGTTERATRNRAYRARNALRARMVASGRALGFGLAALKMRLLGDRSRSAAATTGQRAALATTSLTLAFGTFAVTVPEPFALDDRRAPVHVGRTTGAGGAPAASPPALEPPAVEDGGTTGPEAIVRADVERRYRRPGKVVPESTTLWLEVRTPNGDRIAWKRTSIECDRRHNDLPLPDDSVMLGC